MGKKTSIEEKFNDLDSILEALKGDDISLEEAFNLYNKGIKLVGECDKEIKSVEGKVVKLLDNGEEELF